MTITLPPTQTDTSCRGAVEPRAALVSERARQSLPATITDPSAIIRVSVLLVSSARKKAA